MQVEQAGKIPTFGTPFVSPQIVGEGPHRCGFIRPVKRRALFQLSYIGDAPKEPATEIHCVPHRCTGAYERFVTLQHGART
jgi:hypothetical protein